MKSPPAKSNSIAKNLSGFEALKKALYKFLTSSALKATSVSLVTPLPVTVLGAACNAEPFASKYKFWLNVSLFAAVGWANNVTFSNVLNLTTDSPSIASK